MKKRPGAAADSDAGAAATKEVSSLTLSDGRVAQVREANGRHLEQGAAAARDPGNPISLMMGVVAQVTTIDGTRIVYEDLLELAMKDVLDLVGLVSGNAPAPSLPSVINSSSADRAH